MCIATKISNIDATMLFFGMPNNHHKNLLQILACLKVHYDVVQICIAVSLLMLFYRVVRLISNL